jgi:iron-sulfur cluster repair protein YtfE (RIC family)
MLVQIRKATAGGDVVDLLLACHERIRTFLKMASDLAAVRSPDADEVRSVAAQIHRYFSEALPLHIADEQECILPQIASWSPEIDRALAQMTDDHTAHAHAVDRLIGLCAIVVADPRQLTTVAAELARAASELTTEMNTHLELEERVIFPALRRLTSEQRDEILHAMRERRARVLH